MEIQNWIRGLGFPENLNQFEELESEVYSDVEAYKPPAAFSSASFDYDEQFDDGSD